MENPSQRLINIADSADEHIKPDSYHAIAEAESFDVHSLPSSIPPLLYRNDQDDIAVYTHSSGSRILVSATGYVAVCNQSTKRSARQLLKHALSRLEVNGTVQATYLAT